jgi:uncharacterized membrane protein
MNRPAQSSVSAPAVEPQVRSIAASRPWVWLTLAYHDMSCSPGPSLLHGLLIALGGLIILTLTLQVWQLMPGALSGFLLIGPIICTGLYELSRRRALGERPKLFHVIGAWRRGTRPLVALGVLLFVAATAWVLVSALLFSLFVRSPIDSPLDLLRYAVAGQGTLLFGLWLLAGALGAALVFSLTVVSAPLLLDRRVSLRIALLASVRAVGDNPLPMAIWAAFIMVATLLSMATMMMGFIFAVPVIGHATWHAYRDLLDVSALRERE